MKRDRATFLVEWLQAKTRKPLVIRGARQVGKTWLIRDLAQSQGRQLVELNFEKRPDLESLFTSNDPKETLMHISASIGKLIDPNHTLLFLDEIQVVPNILAKLRWFAEELPELAVVAAGSLLDFALKEHEFSMPVGRISYMYLEPFSFEEFLDATEHEELRKYLVHYRLEQSIPETIHQQLLKLVKEYIVVGGMPAAVLSWKNEKNLAAVNQIQFDLLATYRDDFAKYRGRLSIERLEDILNSVPRQLGKKFVYSSANTGATSASLRQALELLSLGRICHLCTMTSANGLPLGAEADEKFIKVILLDCGLCSAALGLSLNALHSVTELTLVNNGGMAEQLVGQILRTLAPPYISPQLYYWQRNKKGSEAELDFVIQHEATVLPVEVKAGTTGTLKSLHQFMHEKKGKVAVRINSDIPSCCTVQGKDTQGNPNSYQLLSIPFYLLGQLHRLVRSV